jgi:hypothetical protein
LIRDAVGRQGSLDAMEMHLTLVTAMNVSGSIFSQPIPLGISVGVGCFVLSAALSKAFSLLHFKYFPAIVGVGEIIVWLGMDEYGKQQLAWSQQMSVEYLHAGLWIMLAGLWIFYLIPIFRSAAKNENET